MTQEPMPPGQPEGERERTEPEPEPEPGPEPRVPGASQGAEPEARAHGAPQGAEPQARSPEAVAPEPAPVKPALLQRFRRRYGAGPLQLLLLCASFALAGYAGLRLLGEQSLAVAAWFVGTALLHDLVLAPLYGLADRAVNGLGGRRHPRVPASYVRVPAFLSGLLLLVWFPLITGRVARYESVTGLPAGVFLPRWLLLSAALFAASALLLALRAVRGRRSARK